MSGAKKSLPVRANPFAKEAEHLSHSLLAIPEIEAALLAVATKYRRFCVALGCGASIPEAASLAGFHERQQGNHGYHLIKKPEIRKAVDLISLHYSFQVGGIAIGRKRKFLWELAEDNKQKNPAASVAAMKLIAALDGDVQAPSSGVGGITININGLAGASAGQAIEGAVDVAGRIIEHDNGE